MGVGYGALTPIRTNVIIPPAAVPEGFAMQEKTKSDERH
jgi:hypothetical protein